MVLKCKILQYFVNFYDLLKNFARYSTILGDFGTCIATKLEKEENRDDENN